MMNRDDANVMTREDVLRELELLPAWKLRTPIEPVLTQKVAVEKLNTSQAVIVPIEEPAPESSRAVAAIQYEMTMSQDKQWAFLYELGMPVGRATVGLDTAESTLFNNILHALSIEKPRKIQIDGITEFQTKISDIKVVVAMGESISQALLNTQASLESLRDKLHPMGNTQLVATCDLAYLLNNPLDKAKVWQDLCLARSYLQGLHVQV